MFGDISSMPTPAFFYGLKTNEEILVDIGLGKTLMIRLLYVGDVDENGNRSVFFRLNGQTRSVEVKDKKASVVKVSHAKAKDENQIGTPLQGMLSKLFVKEGQKISKNTPMFTIEAMKMETTITASKDLTVQKIILKEGTLVEADDLVLEIA